jgi:flagellar assembly protein FliH
MSSKARRLAVSSSAASALPIASWLEAVADGVVPASGRRPAQRVAPAAAAMLTAMAGPGVPQPPSAAQLEEEIYTRGFAEGQQAAATATQQDTAALARKLAATLDDLVRVRDQMIRHTEKQMVQLALAVARRVVHREVAVDPTAMLTMMRVVLERVSDAARVSVRLNPADHQAVTEALADAPTSDQVTVTADPRVPRGGCKVESEYGDIDAGVDAQIQEIARALLGDTKKA